MTRHKKIILILIFSLLLFSCNKEKHNKIQKKIKPKDNSLYKPCKIISCLEIRKALKPGQGVIVGDQINFRKEPNIKSKSIKLLRSGTKVKIIENLNLQLISWIKDYWYRIEVNGKTGYIFGFYLRRDTSENIFSDKYTGTLIFRKNNVTQQVIRFFSSTQLSIKNSKIKMDFKKKIYYQQVIKIKDRYAAVIYNSGYMATDGDGNDSYMLYDRYGKKMMHRKKRYPIFFHAEKKGLLLGVKTISNGYRGKTYLNQIEVFNEKTKKITRVYHNCKTTYAEVMHSHDNFKINSQQDKFLWVKPGCLTVLNLNNLSIKELKFTIPKVDIKKDMVMGLKTSINRQNLNLEFMFSRAKTRKISIDLDTLKIE